MFGCSFVSAAAAVSSSSSLCSLGLTAKRHAFSSVAPELQEKPQKSDRQHTLQNYSALLSINLYNSLPAQQRDQKSTVNLITGKLISDAQ